MSKQTYIFMFSKLLYVFVFLTVFSCKTNTSNPSSKSSGQTTVKPKLVVGIVVDQMRFEYLSRFKNKYSSNGFLRLIEKGFSCNNHHFNFIPTYTAPGHASVFTGTTPSVHGIIGIIKQKMPSCIVQPTWLMTLLVAS